MKKIILFVVLFSTTLANAQKRYFEKEVQKISNRIEQITKEQKDSLKTKVLSIDKQFEKGEITRERADNLKKEAATYHARRIEKLVGQQELLLQQLVQEKTNGKIASVEDTKLDDDDNVFTIGNKTFKFKVTDNDSETNSKNRRQRWKKKNKNQRSTTTQFVFAIGVNNVIQNGELSSLNNSNYDFWRSRFYELGWTWKTRFSKEPSKLYIKYGASLVWNNLRPEGNRIHVINGSNTEFQNYQFPLTESRLRHVQLNFPVHMELDFSKNKVYNDGRVRDRTNKSVRVGLGGYFGFKLGTRQFLEYQDQNNISIEEEQRDNFNMNRFNYGISSYIGYKCASFYMKYDLNPLFQNTTTRNISFGLRLDLN